jgi:hypothetical protein
MQRFALFVALVAVSIFPVAGSAQGPSVQLCVAGMQVSGGNESDFGGRDLLVKFLSKEKPDKALAIESVPIAPSVPGDALAVAKQKGCDYVVTTNETDTHSVASYSTGRANPVNTPTFYATTAYKLTKASDGSELASGSIKASDGISEQVALGITMRKIADKVTAAIKKAGPIAK